MKYRCEFRIPGPVVVAIPARDEEQRIGACLAALARQSVSADHIVLQLNNCVDNTTAVARNIPVPANTKLHVLECALPKHRANAGHARRLAMARAAALAGDRGILMTTDADGCVDPDWIECNLRALDAGADAIAGWAEIDPVDAATIPRALHDDDARECVYDTLCDEIEALLDPDPNDPWPRHTQHSGASIAVSVSAYRRSGGIPAVKSGEDRAFFAALRRADARIRHAQECHVWVSGRTEGRAAGGMAETIRRRMTTPDRYIDDRLEPVEDWVRRIQLRRLSRLIYHNSGPLAELAGATELDAPTLRALLRAQTFGAVWSMIETSSPTLQRRLVATTELAALTARARTMRDRLRATFNSEIDAEAAD